MYPSVPHDLGRGRPGSGMHNTSGPNGPGASEDCEAVPRRAGPRGAAAYERRGEVAGEMEDVVEGSLDSESDPERGKVDWKNHPVGCP